MFIGKKFFKKCQTDVRFWTNYSTMHAEKYPYLTPGDLPVSSNVFYSALHQVAPMPDRLVVDAEISASEWS